MRSTATTTVLVLLASAHNAAAIRRSGIRVGGGRIGFIIGMVILGLVILGLLSWCCIACCIGASSRRRRGTLPQFYPRRTAGPGMSTTGGAPITSTTGMNTTAPPGTYAAPQGPPPAATGAPAFPQPVHQHGANVV
ncbi:hypothetical protein EXIGLDRAFT_828849 [Exidia glandulosa HHB12029]|uniref:DUF4190 domain-containing protein n=1 Tax=Exidia glandulosa HHB12029 TaxID=1314781 RepID=A0A165Q598_EXIGL|nr:hypothetical protein EXIGLDRAFT_828849 [Exidia glandulosa HHB12029]